ncbi:hypothetical protein [Helicobacter rodentium]|uniref:hypothetical protein n=1 Tax=Helicobacter rodentium TaxID=59617 RepID=UPI0025A4ED0C|nr:hypothetical protein [Helicobacter rodentium]
MTISKNISSLTKITDILHKIRGGGGQKLSLNQYSKAPILLYYYKNVPNLGDLLNVTLCEELFKLPVHYCGDFNYNSAVFIGSILQNFLTPPPQ